MPTNIEITTMQNHAFTKLFLDKKNHFRGLFHKATSVEDKS